MQGATDLSLLAIFYIVDTQWKSQVATRITNFTWPLGFSTTWQVYIPSHLHGARIDPNTPPLFYQPFSIYYTKRLLTIWDDSSDVRYLSVAKGCSIDTASAQTDVRPEDLGLSDVGRYSHDSCVFLCVKDINKMELALY